MASRPMLQLPHGETNPRKRYVFPNPDELAAAYTAVRRHHYNGEREPTRQEMARVLMLAGGYLGLTTYELGQECCVEKLRDIWRARRAAEEKTDGE